MSQHIEAIYINGVFRPEQPVHLAEGERVSLTVDATVAPLDELGDVRDLLDTEFMESCRLHQGVAPSIAEVRQTLAHYPGALSELIRQERDER